MLPACQEKQEKTFVIGISQLGNADAWRWEMKEEIDRELVFNPDLKIIYKEAGYNSAEQVRQIRELAARKIDLLIVSPNEAAPLTPVIDSLYQHGIPVVLVDRNISSDSYTSFIGADNIEVGKLAGQYAAGYLNRSGHIIEITGLPSSTPALQREKGFGDEIARYPNLSVTVISGDWLEGSVQQQLPHMVKELQNTRLIFAHNDVMAHTAANICRQLGFPNIKVIGVDAQPRTGLAFVENRSLLASVLYPTGGGEAIRAAAKTLHGKQAPKRDPLRTIIVDSTNVEMLQQQFNRVIAQQKDIVRQDGLLKEQARIFRSQKNLILILVGNLALLLMLAALLIYLRRKNIKAYKLLQSQNNEIRSQSEQISAMAQQVQEASEQKSNFFTNISHELKTPLTLILAPTEECLQNPKTPAHIRSQFTLIKKNASRLSLLVNQLMDFRKLELNKTRLKIQEVDMLPFISDILDAFKGLAKQHHIDCRLITREAVVKLWIDPGKIEKVFFNILSNAFKFTEDTGHIYVMVEKDDIANQVSIKVVDSGFGLNPQDKAHIFDFFYYGDVHNQNGSGIGLALSKEFVELHHGTIVAESEKNKGTAFTITLPLGHSHYREEEIVPVKDWGYNSEMDTWITDYNIDPSSSDIQSLQPVSDPSSRNTILIVEDNDDLRTFLANRLGTQYSVVTAKNGSEGVRITFEEMPDLVISDIMMPQTDGLQMAQILKTDIRTAHIPIILLTAKTTDEQKVAGLKTNVDAYITKPFNNEVLEVTVHNLLENRQRLKAHVTTDIPREALPQANKGEKAFLSNFNAIVEKNISNENFSIQDLCDQIGMSKIQLYRKAKPLLDVSITEYILLRRVQKAKYLIQHEDLSFAEIAYETGFSTPSYFSTSFKKITGITPKAYKEKYGTKT
ncbi:substrate-binding domain-containing protein [Chitinophaga varians]|uniref:histidine kinase n=1 Tax=Chitinophaga varians TaxID=2202339 RepID=A0A847RWW5_9BACT|nr:substrate-binding domain-containing protein [Chitinophaga varians]NLR67522.1 substrate-binding domain-containing protein [Chitinophaga varians]